MRAIKFWLIWGCLFLILVTWIWWVFPSSKELSNKHIFQLIKMSTINKKVDESWANSIQAGLVQLELPVSSENVCAAIAIIEQESSFHADPKVSGIQNMLQKKLDKLADKPVIGSLLNMRLDSAAKNGKTFRQNIANINTEKQMGEWYKEFTASSVTTPFLKLMDKDLDSLISTVGSMQVSVEFSREFASEHGFSTSDIRETLFTQDGGVLYGMAHLLKGGQSYPEMKYYFADFNAGPFASRNAAFQKMVAKLTRNDLAQDGDLLNYEADGGPQSASYYATLLLFKNEGVSLTDSDVLEDFELEKQAKFSETETYKAVSRLYAEQYKKSINESLPAIKLESEKITRNLTTAWFANRVDGRYQRCIKKSAKLRAAEERDSIKGYLKQLFSGN